MRELRAALIAANKLQDFLEMGQEYFARAIDQRLAELPSRKIAPTDRTAMAHALAGALLSLMTWWVSHLPKRWTTSIIGWCGPTSLRDRKPHLAAVARTETPSHYPTAWG